MDSISQIVLGAAVGEAVLGRKVGNKAPLWGAVIATIPDLDVIPGNLFIQDTIERLLFHRGFSHSFIFSIAAAPLFAWLIKKHPRVFFGLFLLAVFGTLVAGIPSTIFIAVTTLVFAYFGWLTFKMKEVNSQSTIKDWTLLAFFCLVTHPLLDAFTSYGTQLFWPFKERVAWNTIFVADPLYTVPFLICVVVFLFFRKESNNRKWINYAGIIWSCFYLTLTIVNKQYINSIFSDNLASQNIEYTDYITKPMPLNNLLWSVTVNSDSSIYLGYYSLLDENERVNFLKFDKKHEMGNSINDQKKFSRLKFFSDNYYVLREKQDTLLYGDLKFGIMDAFEEEPRKFVMSYEIINTLDGSKFIQNFRKEAPEEGEFGRLIDRVKGIKFKSKY